LFWTHGINCPKEKSSDKKIIIKKVLKKYKKLTFNKVDFTWFHMKSPQKNIQVRCSNGGHYQKSLENNRSFSAPHVASFLPRFFALLQHQNAKGCCYRPVFN